MPTPRRARLIEPRLFRRRKNLLEARDCQVRDALVKDLGLLAAEQYARRMSEVFGGVYRGQYKRVADDLKARIDYLFYQHLLLLQEISQLPGYHPVEGDLGSVPV